MHAVSEMADRLGARLGATAPSVWEGTEGAAWPERERGIAELAGRGWPSKRIAFELGLHESAVCHALTKIARRLGLPSSTLVATWVAERLGVAPSFATEKLTLAERDVLSLVREGLSNGAIARRRGTSERTVANQIASLLRKTGADSRRGLAVLRIERAAA